MRFAPLTLLVPTLVVVGGQGNEAEKLFREMEKKIVSCKSLQVSADFTAHERGQDFKFQGSLALMGNKARIHVSGNFGGQTLTYEAICDGERLVVKAPGPDEHREGAVPKRLHELLTKMTSRASLLGTFFLLYGAGSGKANKDPDPDRLFHVQQFKMGEPEKEGRRILKRVVHYRIDIEGKDAANVTLWVDARTLIPLKRLVAPEKEGDGQITVTYTEFKLNPQLDTKTFELPSR